jgi:hypothetical protein
MIDATKFLNITKKTPNQSFLSLSGGFRIDNWSE